MNKELHSKLKKNYNLMHQTSLWSTFDTDSISFQIWELKSLDENTKPSETLPMYYFTKHIDGLGIIGWRGYNDIDTAFHALYIAYYNYLHYTEKAPF